MRDLPIIFSPATPTCSCCYDNEPFPDPASLFVTPDRAALPGCCTPAGVGLGMRLALAPRRCPRSVPARVARSARTGPVYRGTPVRFWLEAELSDISDVDLMPSAETADAIYDRVAERLATDAYRPRSNSARGR